MTLVVDASVALKWVIDEEGSSEAEALLRAGPLAAPELMLLECANVLAMRVRRGLFPPGQAAAKLDNLLLVPLREVPARPHLPRAQAVALELRQTVYDSLYLAIALAEGATFVTSDARFAQAALASPAYAKAVRIL